MQLNDSVLLGNGMQNDCELQGEWNQSEWWKWTFITLPAVPSKPSCRACIQSLVNWL